MPIPSNRSFIYYFFFLSITLSFLCYHLPIIAQPLFSENILNINVIEGNSSRAINLSAIRYGNSLYLPLKPLVETTELIYIETETPESCSFITPLGNIVLFPGTPLLRCRGELRQILFPIYKESEWWIGDDDWGTFLNWSGLGHWSFIHQKDQAQWVLPSSDLWAFSSQVIGDTLSIILPTRKDLQYRWSFSEPHQVIITFLKATLDQDLWQTFTSDTEKFLIETQLTGGKVVLNIKAGPTWTFSNLRASPYLPGLRIDYLRRKEQIPSYPLSDVEGKLSQDRKKWTLDKVIIDPGHGGKDPGAIGPTRLKEKEVNLDIARRVAAILKDKGIEVVLTREDDRFVPLRDRAQMANRLGGKLFVSLHCNASRNRKASGIETYFLSPAKTERALEVALLENSVVQLEEDPSEYQEVTEENFILLAMAQANFLEESQNLAEIIQNDLTQRLGVSNRGVDQAGFFVLVGASMPAVLIEMGFITHKDEEKRLKTSQYRNKLAEGIAAAILIFLNNSHSSNKY